MTRSSAGQLTSALLALTFACGLACGSSGGRTSQSSGGLSSSTGGGSQGGSGTSSGGAVTGTGTGGAPAFVDGGFVFCAETADAGPAPVEWMCPPGTYFCGMPGRCSQCLSDADCADQDLPTFDPKRQRCDLDSGVAGYQGFCQQCLGGADCPAGGPAVEGCDVDPAAAVASIDAIGFETCAVVGGDCPYGMLPAIGGGCASAACATDQDCLGVLSPTVFPSRPTQQPAPYCRQGSCTSSSDPEFCPNCACNATSTCPGPVAADAGQFCDGVLGRCVCTSSAQCGGLWPVCEIVDAGASFDAGGDAGGPVGACGCDRDDECGDGGLKCLVLPRSLHGDPGPACALACDDPRFPACAKLDAQTPVCDVDSGLCVPCDGPAGAAGDVQCQTHADPDFAGPYCRLDGVCGCMSNADCREGDVCGGPAGQSLTGESLGACVPPPVRCTPSRGAFCDWDSGVSGLACLSDYQCRSGDYDDFCDLDAGACAECRGDTDCVAVGLAGSRGLSSCQLGRCTAGCRSDVDCAGNAAGQHCDTDAGDAFFNSCICLTASECLAGQSCRPAQGQTTARCAGACSADSDCPTAFFCDLYGGCRPRCDTGHGCQAPDSVCDPDDVAGLNGFGVSGNVPGSVWCYACLDSNRCPGDLGCGRGTGFTCGLCTGDYDCQAGAICGVTDALCHAACDAGACPDGEACDAPGAIGNGPDRCYGCLSAVDCPPGEGCNSNSHTCGSCLGPSALGGPVDCPPDAICSNYWLVSTAPGVCLQNCDRLPCPDGTSCGVFPSITPDHAYCFGCRQDADCADAGPGAWCDTSVDLTFTCRPGAGS